jgi:hypothetical protein
LQEYLDNVASKTIARGRRQVLYHRIVAASRPSSRLTTRTFPNTLIAWRCLTKLTAANGYQEAVPQRRPRRDPAPNLYKYSGNVAEKAMATDYDKYFTTEVLLEAPSPRDRAPGPAPVLGQQGDILQDRQRRTHCLRTVASRGPSSRSCTRTRATILATWQIAALPSGLRQILDQEIVSPGRPLSRSSTQTGTNAQSAWAGDLL